MVIGTSNLIEKLPLNDCQPRLKSNLTTHEMEIILCQTSNWYVKRTIRLDIHILSYFHRLSWKMGFLIHSRDIKWTPEAGVFIGKFFFKSLYDIKERKVIVSIIKDMLKAFNDFKNMQKRGWSNVFLINRNFENVSFSPQ